MHPLSFLKDEKPNQPSPPHNIRSVPVHLRGFTCPTSSTAHRLPLLNTSPSQPLHCPAQHPQQLERSLTGWDWRSSNTLQMSGTLLPPLRFPLGGFPDEEKERTLLGQRLPLPLDSPFHLLPPISATCEETPAPNMPHPRQIPSGHLRAKNSSKSPKLWFQCNNNFRVVVVGDLPLPNND